MIGTCPKCNKIATITDDLCPKCKPVNSGYKSKVLSKEDDHYSKYIEDTNYKPGYFFYQLAAGEVLTVGNS